MSYIQCQDQVRDLYSKRFYPKETKARILPYYVSNNTINFLFCQEYFKHEFINGKYNILGGRREYNETIIECAKRELKEETCNTLKLNDIFVKDELILKKNKRYIIFLPIYNNINKIVSNFEKNKKLLENKEYKKLNLTENDNIDCFSEIKELIWIDQSKIRGYDIYKSVQDVFKNIYTADNYSISFYDYMNILKKNYYNKYKNYNYPVFKYYSPNVNNYSKHPFVPI